MSSLRKLVYKMTIVRLCDADTHLLVLALLNMLFGLFNLISSQPDNVPLIPKFVFSFFELVGQGLDVSKQTLNHSYSCISI